MTLLALAAVGFPLGLVLGLLGGGGAILAIPLLVHVVGQPIDEASTTSLVLVGVGAAAGLITHARAGRVDWRAGLTFGVLGSAGAVLGARAAVLVDDRLQLAGFLLLIAIAGVSMIRGPRRSSSSPAMPARRPSVALTVLAASVVGLVTGFFGVGGGFVAVPALVFGLGLPVRRATATGLVVIAVNAAVALAARGDQLVEPGVTAWLAASAAAGGVLGALWSARLPADAIRRGFGVLVLVLGLVEAVLLVGGR